jgi:hypothetical protein
MKTFAPDLRKFSMDILEGIAAHGNLRYPFPDHPFSAMTFNLGPVALTKPHKDVADLSWGWCAVTSMGNFDPTKGGHLVLWDLELAIEFPPYSTIFIPSSILRHSNTSIGPGELRSSVTQYNTMGMFRWAAFDYSLKGERTTSGKGWWDSASHMFTWWVGFLSCLNPKVLSKRFSS